MVYWINFEKLGTSESLINHSDWVDDWFVAFISKTRFFWQISLFVSNFFTPPAVCLLITLFSNNPWGNKIWDAVHNPFKRLKTYLVHFTRNNGDLNFTIKVNFHSLHIKNSSDMLLYPLKKFKNWTNVFHHHFEYLTTRVQKWRLVQHENSSPFHFHWTENFNVPSLISSSVAAVQPRTIPASR